MKRIILSSLLVLAVWSTQAQAPAKFNYQGIARTSAGQPLASQAVAMRISIMDGTATGTVVYKETQSTVTNAYGLYNVSIGSGTVETGTMETVDWSSGDKYIKVELDPAGGTTYADLGTSNC
jgi:hypothetical protein